LHFKEIKLKSEIISGLEKINIQSLTDIQEKSFPSVTEGKNVFIHSETGSGKTFCFLLPLLNKINLEDGHPQAVIVSPTHELSSQIVDNVRIIAEQSGISFKAQLLIGETPVKRQLERLKKKPHLVVGTPGRILELIKMRKLKVHQLQMMIFDEADKLFEGKFLETCELIIKAAQKSIQYVFASASKEEVGFQNILESCENIEVIETASEGMSDNITHIYIEASKLEKKDLLRKFLHCVKSERTLIFVHKNHVAEDLAEFLKAKKFKASTIHAEGGKENRKGAIEEFKKSKIDILVCSDVASRGLHIDDVENVVNFDVPSKKEAYLHRAGRTGRLNAKGHCMSLTSRHDLDTLKRIQDELDIDIYEVQLVNGKVELVKEND
jgi:ATP-dependent RNA helicase DeaD